MGESLNSSHFKHFCAQRVIQWTVQSRDGHTSRVFHNLPEFASLLVEHTDILGDQVEVTNESIGARAWL